MFLLVEAYYSGEMNRSDFWKAHDLSLSTFNYLLSKLAQNQRLLAKAVYLGSNAYHNPK
ncbi:MAG: hypothetical protein AAF694_27160 [Bacteroidota bacterium]